MQKSISSTEHFVDKVLSTKYFVESELFSSYLSLPQETELRAFDQIFRLFDFFDLNFINTLLFLNIKFLKSEYFTLSRKMKNSKIVIQIRSSSFSKKSVFHVESRHQSTLSSSEMSWGVCNEDFRYTLNKERCVCIWIVMRNLEKSSKYFIPKTKTISK